MSVLFHNTHSMSHYGMHASAAAPQKHPDWLVKRTCLHQEVPPCLLFVFWGRSKQAMEINFMFKTVYRHTATLHHKWLIICENKSSPQDPP